MVVRRLSPVLAAALAGQLVATSVHAQTPEQTQGQAQSPTQMQPLAAAITRKDDVFEVVQNRDNHVIPRQRAMSQVINRPRRVIGANDPLGVAQPAGYDPFRVVTRHADILEISRQNELFHSGDRATTKGAGLGLAIARRLVEAHGGRIWIEAGPGRGARFVITLPLDVAAIPR